MRASLPVRVSWRDPRVFVRALLGTLTLANVAAGLVVLKPWGGSPADLEEELRGLMRQVQQRDAAVKRLRELAGKIDKGRIEGDRFVSQFFLDRRTAYSTLVEELAEGARKAGIRPREQSYAYEPIEGSDTLGMLTITAHYEGSYADLVHMIHVLDRSPRLLILESLQAAPQAQLQGGGVLNVVMKFNTFVAEEGAIPETAAAAGPPPAVSAEPVPEPPASAPPVADAPAPAGPPAAPAVPPAAGAAAVGVPFPKREAQPAAIETSPVRRQVPQEGVSVPLSVPEAVGRRRERR